MNRPILLRLREAAEAVSVSPSTLERAVHQRDPNGYPPPIKAKRLGTGARAALAFDVAELEAWAAKLPDA